MYFKNYYQKNKNLFKAILVKIGLVLFLGFFYLLYIAYPDVKESIIFLYFILLGLLIFEFFFIKFMIRQIKSQFKELNKLKSEIKEME